MYPLTNTPIKIDIRERRLREDRTGKHGVFSRAYHLLTYYEDSFNALTLPSHAVLNILEITSTKMLLWRLHNKSITFSFSK